MSTQNIQTAFELLRDELFSNLSGNGASMVTVTLDCFFDVKSIQEKYNRAIQRTEENKTSRNIIKFPVRVNNSLSAQVRTQEIVFEPIIQSVLEEIGGAAFMGTVIESVFEKMHKNLSGFDMALLRDGEPRWRNTLRWSVMKMKEKGLISSQSPRGIWRLADKPQLY